ncbi:MAG: uridine diphosphate-N-acetylglucosamine-binding protein YvcK [Clostridia bacterium]|nr:uridine diphosphate-N-acetylglucosamine-binding protein YvcK [Clostridia bacterium]
MKGFMQWFKSSNKMKRWMFLILIGILLACYGLAEILVMREISFEEVGKVVVVFVLGFISIVLGLIFLNKRTMEVLIEATDRRMENKKNVNVKSLIFNKKIYDKGPNIVVIGGGTGLNTVLSGLKNYTSNLTAIVTISDYGEGINNSRKTLEMPPLGDVKDSMVSLATKEGEIENLLNYEFKKGKLAGLNFSDIYFSAMKEINGNLGDAIIKSNEVLGMIGKVIPVTLNEMNIVAELANGYLVEQKSKIQEVISEKLTRINRIFLNPSNCKVAPGVVEAIKKADCIIIGPGSLYTNVIPNLLVNGVAKAIKESPAIKVYVSNIMTEPGQTDEYSVSDHLNAIIEHCGKGMIDYCIYDTGEVIPEFIKKYNKEGQELVEQDIDKVRGIKFLQRNLSMVANDHIRHDPNLVATSIIELICDDLKYQDKQNDPQYLMLSNKLREEKRIGKIKKAMKKKEKKKTEGKRTKVAKGKSKFSSKYSERIESIRESDGKARTDKLPKEEAKKVKKQEKVKEEKRKEEKKKEKKKKEKQIENEMIETNLEKKIETEVETKIEEQVETKIEKEESTSEKTNVTTSIDLEQAKANLEQVLAAARADLEKTKAEKIEKTEEPKPTKKESKETTQKETQEKAKTPKPKSARGMRRKKQTT